ncbi:rho GTPase-activating protein 18-like [Physella acuta]|uniref:rho GTPase-activating protein 18-like n=1 Tax=Physella acuta TaxID=109671 RepID=UPI0027DE4475|nr:rho GTPase-activating protein 18-like [Physella acuta]
MVLLTRLGPNSLRQVASGANTLASKTWGVSSYSPRDENGKFQEFCRQSNIAEVLLNSRPIKTAKTLKYWSGQQRPVGLFGHGKTESIASFLKAKVKPWCLNSNVCWVPCARYAQLPETLPPYDPIQDNTGVTYLHDLAHEDAERVRELSYQAMKTMLKDNNIKLAKRSKKKHKYTSLYGSTLEDLVAKEVKEGKAVKNYAVPSFFMQMAQDIEVRGTTKEGIFRIPGVHTKKFKEDAEANFYKGSFDLTSYEPKEVASGMKAFLRDLPESLISHEKLETFPRISELPLWEQVKVLTLFFNSMQVEHRDTLRVLIYMSMSVNYSPVTKMNNTNMAVVFGPNVMLIPKLKDLTQEAKWTEENLAFARIIFTYCDKLWVIPPAILNQLRQQYISGSVSKKKPLFPWKRSKVDTAQATPSAAMQALKEASIDVHAPELAKKEATVKITPTTTANDVVDIFGVATKVHKRPITEQLASRENDIYYLYEVGGNIAERCIDPHAKVLDVYKINPEAEFCIRPKKGR